MAIAFCLLTAPRRGSPARSATQPQADGRRPGFADVAIAAIAKSRGFVILTLNLCDFEPPGVETLNPFNAV